MTASWFEDLMGFQERSYEETRSFSIGELETPSLLDLRSRAASVVDRLAGKLKVCNVSGDIRRMHRDPANKHALFQVASQFNLLEMVGPHVTPEDGVTRYIDDRTQGPACALAAAAATVYRNYLVPVDGQLGQTRDRQIDCLMDVGSALDNATEQLWTMRNGYALCTAKGLATIAQRLEALDASGLDNLRDRIRIGIHGGVQVTDAEDAGFIVSQAFCSALPVSYTDIRPTQWKPFAALVLEGAYEATLWAAVLNAHRFSSRMVFMTQLGGGAFGNESQWIHDAIRRALKKVVGVGLDVRLVSYREPDPRLERLVGEFL